MTSNFKISKHLRKSRSLEPLTCNYQIIKKDVNVNDNYQSTLVMPSIIDNNLRIIYKRETERERRRERERREIER